MTHRADTATDNRLADFLKNEPVVIGAAGAAAVTIVGLAVAFGAPISDSQSEAILAAIGPVLALGFLVVRSFTRSAATSTSDKDVVEAVQDGVVLAGPANELPTGTQVRELGSLGLEDEHSTLEAGHASA